MHAAWLAQGVGPRHRTSDGLAPLDVPGTSLLTKCISFTGISEDTEWCQHSCGAPVPDCPDSFCQCEDALPVRSLDERMGTGDTAARDPWACALDPPPVQIEVSAFRRQPPWTDVNRDVVMGIPAFFLHETGGHNWRAVEESLWRLTPFSRHVCAGQSQHQGSLFLLQALRKHWKRTEDVDSAGVHVSAALMSESGMRVLGEDGQHASCQEPPPEDLYSSQLNRLADELEVPNGPFLSGKPFVFLTAASAGEGFMLRHPRLNATLRRGNPVFVTNDANYMAQPSWLERLHGYPAEDQARVLLPYLSDDSLAAAAASEGLPTPMKDRAGVMFHGSLLRNGNEAQPRLVRKQMETMLGHLDSSTPTNLNMETFPSTNFDDPVDDEAPVQVIASAHAMQTSRICLAPEGDTPMSRRLVDALAAGCVPVFYVSADEDTDGKRRELPLAHSIDWRAIAFFMKASNCPKRDAEWLGETYADVVTLQRMSNAGRLAFNRLLSFGNRTKNDDTQAPIRMATALLFEVSSLRGNSGISSPHSVSSPSPYAGDGEGGADVTEVDSGSGHNIWGGTAATGACKSTQPGDASTASCEGWCQVEHAAKHCRWCKCRNCLRLTAACAADLAID